MSAEAFQAEIRRGIAARNMGDLPTALKAFEAAIALEPEKSNPYLRAAEAQISMGRHKNALRTTATALAMPCTISDRSWGLRIRAVALMNTRSSRKAEATAREAIANQPLGAYNHALHARTLWRRRKFKAATAAFEHALTLSPQDSYCLSNYAQFLKARMRYEAAMQLVERAMLTAPDQFDLLLLRGQLAFKLDQVEMARDMALWALSQRAMNRPALELLAMVQSRKSRITAPFWWLVAWVSAIFRRHKIIFIAVVAVVTIAIANIPASWQQQIPLLDSITPFVLIAALSYPYICTMHVAYLVKRDLKEVKLKRNF